MERQGILLLFVMLLLATSVYSITFKTIYNPFTTKLDYYSVASADNLSITDLNITGNLIVLGQVNTTRLIATFVNTTYLNVTGTDRNATFQGDIKIIGTLYGGSPVKIAGINLTSGNITTLSGDIYITNATPIINLNIVSLSLGWTNLTNYPVACPSGNVFITQLDDSITCTEISTTAFFGDSNWTTLYNNEAGTRWGITNDSTGLLP